MTVKNFLKMHQNGCAQSCISIQQLPYDHEKRCYSKTYFEECDQEEILSSDTFKEISSKQVDHFHVIGGGIYPVELCVYVREEQI